MKPVFLPLVMAVLLLPSPALALIVTFDVTPKFVQENPKAFSVKVERRKGGLIRVTIVRFLDKGRYLSAVLKVQEGEAVLFESRFAAGVSGTSASFQFALPANHLAGASFLLGESITRDTVGGEVYRMRLQDFLPKRDEFNPPSNLLGGAPTAGPLGGLPGGSGVPGGQPMLGGAGLPGGVLPGLPMPGGGDGFLPGSPDALPMPGDGDGFLPGLPAGGVPGGSVPGGLPGGQDEPGAPSNVVITIDGNGSLHVDRNRVTREQLPQRLRAALAKNRTTTVIVRVDASAPYGTVVGVVDAAKKAGATKVNLAVATIAEPKE